MSVRGTNEKEHSLNLLNFVGQLKRMRWRQTHLIEQIP